MQIGDLFHVAIKTHDLVATERFYCTLLGLRKVARPDFGYPGAWLASPRPGGQALIHVYAGGPALGAEGRVTPGTAAIDHISITATGFHELRARLHDIGLPWREYLVPGTQLWQLFVYDPSGVQLELTFDGGSEPGAAPDMSPGKGYVAGVSFFDAGHYAHFAKDHPHEDAYGITA